jgi:hypothetical protein
VIWASLPPPSQGVFEAVVDFVGGPAAENFVQALDWMNSLEPCQFL